MGTSSARRAPRTASWRAAKAAATRYMSPEGGTPAAAQEMISLYLTALEETRAGCGEDLLADFIRTRKAAQELGAYLLEGAGSGSERASPRPHWQPEDGSLEGAVVRTAVAAALRSGIVPTASASPEEAARQVGRFLATVLHYRLLLDLGEPLEAAAPGGRTFRQRLALPRDMITTAAAAAVAAAGPPPPGSWRGLAGWQWLTRVLTALWQELRSGPPPGGGATIIPDPLKK
jgi:hypothetical protein